MNDLKYFFVGILLIITTAALYYVGFFNYIVDAWGNEDFRLGVLAEIHGVILETILVVGLLSWLMKRREDLQWKPSRLIVAREMYRFHRTIMNSLRFTIDPNYHTNLEQHGLPKNFTQRQADAWGRKYQVNHLDASYNALKKMLEYNNIAMDASIHPLVMTYIVNVEKVLGTVKFVYHAYNNENNTLGGYLTSINKNDFLEMENIYFRILKKFPEIEKLESINTMPLVSAKDILKYIEQSNHECDFLNIIVK